MGSKFKHGLGEYKKPKQGLCSDRPEFFKGPKNRFATSEERR